MKLKGKTIKKFSYERIYGKPKKLSKKEIDTFKEKTKKSGFFVK